MRSEPSVSSSLLGEHFKNTGVFKKTTADIAKIHNADGAMLSSHGTTLFLQVIAGYVVMRYGRGATVLVPSNVHKSFIDAASLYSLKVRFIPVSSLEGYEAVAPSSPSDVKHALEAHPDVQAVIFVSPTYDLLHAELRDIATTVHENGVPIIVDGAWDHLPHIPFEDDIDVLLKSTHKMEGAHQGGACLLYRRQRIDEKMLWKSYGSIVSTSPSILIMADVDRVYKKLRESPELLSMPTAWATDVKRLLAAEGIRVLTADDVDRLIPGTVKFVEDWKIHVYLEHASGFELKRKLEMECGIVAEKAGPKHIQFIAGWRVIRNRSPQKFVDSLLTTLRSVTHVESCDSTLNIPFLHEKEQEGRIRLEVYEPLGAPSEYVTPRQAIGRISAESQIPYPPGCPCTVPGMEITAKDVLYLKELSAMGGDVVCGRDHYFEVVRQ